MKAILTRLFNHEELTTEEARQLLLNISRGIYPEAQVAALLTVFQMRSITVDELAGFREALMETRIHINFAPYRPIDIVGTGGDGKNTFNISTCACFVVAGAGYKVAKHGNYAATSTSGASNVIEHHACGSRPTATCYAAAWSVQLCLPACPAVRPRNESRGPRTQNASDTDLFQPSRSAVNPCRPAYQLLGVANLNQMRLYSSVYEKLGIGYGIVNSIDGYDEISLTGNFKVKTNTMEKIFRPADLGLPTVRPEELYGGTTPDEAAEIFDSVLENRCTESRKNVVLANAAFAIKVIERDKDIAECLAIARESLESDVPWLA